jgi:Rod binding domain-containing protein
MQSLAATAAASPGDSSAPPPRLVRAAHEFEAQMMQELMKPMTHIGSMTGDDDDSASGSSGALGSFASEALGRGLSEHGGFGIARSVLEDLSHSGHKIANGKVTGNLHKDTGIKASE